MNMFNKLKKLLDKNQDIVDVGVSFVDDDLILLAERHLNQVFPTDYKTYLIEWGTLAIGPDEYYGICDKDFINSCIPDGIWFTDLARKNNELPTAMIVLKNNEGVHYHCLLIEDGRYSVVVWDVSSKMIIMNKGNDLFEYIYEESLDFIGGA